MNLVQNTQSTVCTTPVVSAKAQSQVEVGTAKEGKVVNVPQGKALAIKDKDGKVLAKVKNDSKVTIHSVNKETGKTKISYDGHTGEVNSKFITSHHEDKSYESQNNISINSSNNSIGVNHNNVNPDDSIKVTSHKEEESHAINYDTRTYYVSNTNGLGLNVRTGAGTNHSIMDVLNPGSAIKVISVNDGWAEVLVGGQIGYVSANYISTSVNTNNYSNNISDNSTYSYSNNNSYSGEGYSTGYSDQSQDLPLTPVTIIPGLENDNKADTNYTQHSLQYFLNNPGRIQNLMINKYRGVNLVQLNKILNHAGVLIGKADVIASACKKYNLDPVYFLAQTIYEGGWGNSELARGVEYNGETVYDLFGIGACDSNPLGGAERYAYSHGWTSVDKAIYGAAQFLSTQYVNSRQYQQNTPYRLIHAPNPQYSWHAYCTGDYYPRALSQLIQQFSSVYNSNDTFEYSN